MSNIKPCLARISAMESNNVLRNSPPTEIQRMLVEFDDVLTTTLPKGLPPPRAINHQISIIPGSSPQQKHHTILMLHN